MSELKLKLNEAKKLILHSQYLDRDSSSASEVLSHLGYVQIDTLAVVERAHHHVFWSRFPKYKVQNLGQLVKERKAFEYWSHAAAFLPMEDYRFSLPRKLAFRKSESSWFPRDPKMMKKVLSRIEKEGPLGAVDFKSTTKRKGGWGNLKPEKKALERLFMEGKLEVSHRNNFQKVFDLPERVIPNNVDLKKPSESEYANYLINRTLRHHGLASAKEMAYLCKKNQKQAVEKEVSRLIRSNSLRELSVEGLSDTYFCFEDSLEQLPRASRKLHILSPFDNFIIQRDKLKSFFDFDYQIECYVPEAKRRYGYFTLPVLAGTSLIARPDCKVHRSEAWLEVKSYNWEKPEYEEKYFGRLEKKLKLFEKFCLSTDK